MLTKYTAYAKEYIHDVLPKKLSQLTNDTGYITKNSDILGTAAMAIADKDGNPIITTYEKKVDAQIALNKKADKATTLSGYGITDSYTKTEEDTKLKDKADASNVYTKQQVLDKLDLKADKAITLAGYFIGDAYTKTEVDDKLAKKADLESLHMPEVLAAIDARLKKTDAEATYIKKAEKGVANGIATLDSSGLIPSNQLPSYVDDVVEGYYNSTDNKFYKEETHTTVLTGEDGKIYVDIPSNHSFRYAPTSQAYIKIDDAVSTAERALKDSDGNDINATYEKKTDAAASLDKKADKTTVSSLDTCIEVVEHVSSNNATAIGFETDGTAVKEGEFVHELSQNTKDPSKSVTIGTNLNALDKGIVSNKNDIAANKVAIDNINNNISENNKSINTLRNDMNTNISSITTRVSTAENSISTNETAIANINKQIAGIQTSASSTYATKTELADKTKPATTTSLGTIIVGDNLTIDSTGKLSAKNAYTLPIATATVLGGIKQGTDVTIDTNGVLSVNYTDFTANCTEENFAKLYAES